MFKNYFLTAWRNIRKHKSFSLINILGLTAGTICCIYILLFVKDQYGYDTHHKDAAAVYRVRTDIQGMGKDEFNIAAASPPIAFGMKTDFPEVQVATRVLHFTDAGDNLLKAAGAENGFYESKGYQADSTFFQVFTYRFIEGTPLHALDEPYTVVLSAAVAKKLFGNKEALNQQITISNRFGNNLFKVTGVFDENFGKSHLRPHFIMNMNSGGIGEFVRSNNQWAGQNFVYTYVKLNPNTDAKLLEAKLPAFLLKHGADNLRELGMKKTLYLQPVTDIYLHSKGITYQIDKTSGAQFLHLLLAIAAFIQLIACINFINLTTARSLKRAREIGVRKVVGAMKSYLIGQFLGESIMISLIATILAIPLLLLLLPWLNTLTDGTISAGALNNPEALLIIAGIALLTGLLAGIYPAIYLSGFQPVKVLKGTFKFHPSSVLLRKGLVVFQFAIAIILIVSVIIISQQVNYMQTKDLGFDQQQRLVVAFQTDPARGQYNAFNNEVTGMQAVEAAGGCMYYPSKQVLQDFGLYKKGQNMTNAQLIKINRVNEDFFKVMGISLLAGRNLDITDTLQQTMVVNEATLKALQLNINEAIGTRLYGDFEGQRNEFEIVGVIKDYNFNSLREPVQPLASLYTTSPSYMVLEYRSANTNHLLVNLQSAWEKLVPGEPFQYTFLDQDIQQQYADEKTVKRISNSFTALAILISCLGLFGLAMFTAQQRVKEIGVRKVLGASVTGIASMLSKDFLKLVLISLLIASPLAWWAMHQWLADFNYRIPINWWVFVLAGGIAMLVAVITISFQAIKAALANPVKSLRTE